MIRAGERRHRNLAEHGHLTGLQLEVQRRAVATAARDRRGRAQEGCPAQRKPSNRTVASYARKHEAGAAAFLDEHRVLVVGGLERAHATAELCSF